MKTVSIIMPCYNDGLYIEEAINSVQNQTYPNTELIVIDDGSTDSCTINTLTALKERGVTILHTDHLGPAAARNYGIANATGDFILPLDADDKIAPTYLEKAVSVLEQNPDVGAVYCYADLFGEQNGRWEIPEYSLQRMLQDNIVFITSVFWRKDWETVRGFCEDLKYGMEDYDFWLSFIELGKTFYQLPETLFFYRIKKKSRTSELKKEYWKIQESYQLIFERHQKLYEKHYDIVIPALRNSLLEQMHIRGKYDEIFAFVHWIRKLPLLRKFLRIVIRQ